jgi:hypothetical protein
VREGKAEAATAWGEQIIQTHRRLARDILRDSFPPATHLPLLEEALRQFAEDLMLLQFLPYGSVSVPAQITRLVTWGARLAAILGALVLEKAGLPAWPLPEPAIVTAHPDPDTTREGLRMAPALLAPTRRHAFRLVLPVLSRQQIPVIAGGGATTEWGGVTLLAPGEEELTAALLAVVFRARALTLYTTQPGLLSADPALPGTRRGTPPGHAPSRSGCAVGRRDHAFARHAHPGASGPVYGVFSLRTGMGTSFVSWPIPFLHQAYQASLLSDAYPIPCLRDSLLPARQYAGRTRVGKRRRVRGRNTRRQIT